MAFTNLYLNPAATGANDLNSGSTTAAPTHTYGGGTFVRATGVYTVASGNPSTDGFVSAGDYVSIYTTTGRTVATFVALVGSTTATTIVTSTTIVYGLATTVSETANASSLTIGGSWISELPLAATATAGGLGTFTAPQSTKINLTGNLTIAATRTISMAGATTAPLWFSFYSATPGDLDNDTTNSLTKPVWTLGAFSIQATGTYQLWSGVSMVANTNASCWVVSGTASAVSRVRSENTNSGTSTVAFSLTGVNASAYYSWFKTPTTATVTGTCTVNSATTWVGCVSVGNGRTAWNIIGNTANMIDCVALNVTGVGILGTTPQLRLFRCTFLACTTDGVKTTGAPQSHSAIVGCVFAGPNGGTAMTNGINNASGTNSANIFRACNDYYNVTNPEVGLGDAYAFFPQTDSSYPFISATDWTPIVGANARNNGFPGIFENSVPISYADIGAARHPDPASGGGGVFGG